MPKTNYRTKTRKGKFLSYLRGLAYLGTGLISAPVDIGIRGRNASQLKSKNHLPKSVKVFSGKLKFVNLDSDNVEMIGTTLDGNIDAREFQNPVLPVVSVKVVDVEELTSMIKSRLKEHGQHRSGFANKNRRKRKPMKTGVLIIHRDSEIKDGK